MSVLVDTNVLLRRTQPNHEHHAVAMESVARLLAANETVCFTPQNISEFWNVVTRPVAHNGLGFSVSLVAGEVEKIEHRHLHRMEALGH
jgi:predicted nucleic acid-binding protein